MTLTIRRAHSQQSALEAAADVYEQMLNTLVALDDQRLARLAKRSYDRGLVVFDNLRERASDEELDEADESLLDWYLQSAQSDDPEHVRMWLGLLPESLEQLFAAAILEDSEEADTTAPEAPDPTWTRWSVLMDRHHARRLPTAV